ncbi:hypothetical protein HY479_02305 [Candidatus Uhrbacteria bacterium]|nr:hypothetical protein [Candidatus Uhrbacteria bacterium]
MNKVFIVLGMICLLALAWAPWMNNRSVHALVLDTYGSKDNAIQEGKTICDYAVLWAPFGRWVASCEGGYFVPFWEKI